MNVVELLNYLSKLPHNTATYVIKHHDPENVWVLVQSENALMLSGLERSSDGFPAGLIDQRS